jgi:hypothetical protein
MRKFNISGRIILKKHYYVELTQQIEMLMQLIDDETYFVINRPRQFGKTTLLSFLATHLLESDRFLPLLVSFEGYGGKPDIELEVFYEAFLEKAMLFLESEGVAFDWQPIPFEKGLSTFHFQKNIRQYYHQHTHETGQVFDERVIARVHHVTNGHPWLVSMLAKSLVEEIVPDREQKIVPEHAEEAIQILANSRNMNFESLFKNARHPDIFPIVVGLLMGSYFRYNMLDDDIYLGVKYGIFAKGNHHLMIANAIYAQVLYQHFEKQLKAFDLNSLMERNNFEDVDGRLNFSTVLEKFQIFMKAKGASVVKHPEFREATAQLLFLSYLDLLVNDKGWTFKEVHSGEGRIDVLCTYGRQKEVVELKLWYGARKYEDGLEQLAKYLDSENLNHGYLLVFDRRDSGKKVFATSEHVVAGKRILAWVV